MTLAWGPFGVTLVTVKEKLIGKEMKRSHERHVGEFAAYDEAVRQALAALAQENADEHRIAEIVNPERDGKRELEATVAHPDFGGTVTMRRKPPIAKPKPMPKTALAAPAVPTRPTAAKFDRSDDDIAPSDD
jgi:Arc/MetJ-type ribon-helix-helix transcriptional regulator